MLRSAAIGVVFAVTGAVIGGTLGAMSFIAAASWLSTLMAWWQFRYALRQSGHGPGTQLDVAGPLIKTRQQVLSG